MADSGKSTSLAERDQMTMLLRFLESDVNIGPANEAKRRGSIPLYGRRSQALPQSTHLPSKQSVLSPPLVGERIQTFYVDQWPPLTVKRGDTILFPSNGVRKSSCNIGGVPISLDTAIELRKVVYGSSLHSFSSEWRKSTLGFCCIDGPFPYGIHSIRCGSRALSLIVQGFLLKHLIFDREYKTSSLMRADRALCPNDFERRRAMIGGLCEMLWQAGDKRRAIVCLKNENISFGPDYRYKPDTITEKLQLFEFKIFEDLQHFVKRNLEQFQVEHGNGCILFLYSLAMSRGLGRIREDMQADHESKAKLLTDMEDAGYALINLALTGKATSFIHNGELLYDKKGHLLSGRASQFVSIAERVPTRAKDRPVYGVKARGQVGFLFWDKGEEEDKRTEVGSMLKTPKNPIWVTKVNGLYGLLFSLNPDLVCDWRVENRFTMWYYTGLVTQAKPTVLNLETRIGRQRPKTALARRDQASRVPALENCIMTKWYGAAINWNGTIPFI